MSSELQTDVETLEVPFVPPAFVVRDEDTADWVVKKVVMARLEMDRLTDQYKARMAELGREEDWFLRRFDAELREWAGAQIAGGKKRSVKLAHGTVGFRATPGGITVEDEAAAIAAAKTQLPEAVKVRETLLLTPVKEYLEKTGSLLAGCAVKPAGENFYVK